MTIKIDSNVADIQRRLRALEKRLGTIAPALETMGRKLKTRIQLAFKAGEDPYGKSWLPLKLRSGQPLRDTGRLMGSIDYRSDATSVTVGTNVCYAPVHQFGAHVEAGLPPHQSICDYYTKGSPFLAFQVGGRWFRAKSVTIPARPFLPDKGMPPEWGQDILSAFNKWIEASKKAAGAAANPLLHPGRQPFPRRTAVDGCRKARLFGEQASRWSA